MTVRTFVIPGTRRLTRSIRSTVVSTRGVTLAIVAVMMVATLGMIALAIDLGMAFTSRSEAQRASDAASLAAASVFAERHWKEAGVVNDATQRAKAFAISNHVRGMPVDTATPEFFAHVDAEEGDTWVSRGPEVTIQVMPQTQKVRVWVERSDLPTWFARLVGVETLGIKAQSASQVSPGGTVQACVLPFTVVDLWDDKDDDVSPANRLPDAGEEWLFEDGAELDPGQEPDEYYTYDVAGIPGTSYGSNFDGTGYGSSYRNGVGGAGGPARSRDMGRRIILKSSPQGGGGPSGGGSPGGGWDPNGSGTVGPGNFQIWTMPDPEADCEFDRDGADFVRENIAGCNVCSVSVGADYPTRTGNVSSIKAALDELYARDPGAEWVEDPTHHNGGYITGSKFSSPEQNSPLVKVVPIMPPTINVHGDVVPVQFVQFAKIFLEPQAPKGTIYGRFLGGVAGSPGGTPGASLIKYLRIVE